MADSYTFHIQPRDLLFMRDARPMAASDAGLGSHWPRPDQVRSAFIHAFNRRWPERQDWEHEHHKTDAERENRSRDRFGGLKTAGPFPATENGLWLPCPLDLSSNEVAKLVPMSLVDGQGTNLPPPLTQCFQSAVVGKNEPPTWICKADYDRYLKGEAFVPRKPREELYTVERQVGVAIDAQTGTTVEGQLYQAEYLRLNNGTSLAVEVSCRNVGKNGQEVDVIAKIADETNPLILGGQQGVVTAKRLETPMGLPADRVNGEGKLIKWTLLSPAVYPELAENPGKGVRRHPGGWLPTWVAPDNGTVMLPRGALPPKPGRTDRGSREAWRQEVARLPKFKARLVAARIGKPVAFSGWEPGVGPKPTQLAVPAGSCYVFECVDNAEAVELAKALSWSGGKAGGSVAVRRSTVFGEKGFGIGVCSVLNKA